MKGASEASFEAFVTARGGPMLSMARALVRTDADAEDLLHDTLARALERWGRVGAADDPAAYVNRMLVNAATSWWRRGIRREQPTAHENLAHVTTGPFTAAVASARVRDEVADADDRHDLLAALRRLPVRQRAVLVLRFYDAMPDAQIAATLGVAPATVRSTTARALAALRRDGHLRAPVST